MNRPTTDRSFQRLAGAGAVALAMIYLVAFVHFGAFWDYPGDASAADKLAYLAAQQTSFTLVYLLMYVVFGAVLSIVIVGLHDKLRPAAGPGLQLATLFGAVWVGLVIASGMISTIGLASVLEWARSDAEQAFAAWGVITLIAESIGGGNELVGGLWVLLLSIVALRASIFPPGVSRLGCLVGTAGVATVYPAEILTTVFGLSQIVWFLWIGAALLRDATATPCAEAASQQTA